MRVLGFVGLIVTLLLLRTASASAQDVEEIGRLREHAAELFEEHKYTEALSVRRAVAAKTESLEKARAGVPGRRTAGALQTLAWYALFAREPAEALEASERGLKVAPEYLPLETNRAHALLLLGRIRDAEGLYLAHKGKQLNQPLNEETWEEAIVQDFEKLTAAGVVHEAFARIVAELGISHPELASEIITARETVSDLYHAGKYEEGAKAAAMLIDLTRRRYGEESTVLASAISWLGRSEEKLNLVKEAEPLFKRSVAIAERALGPNRLEVAKFLYNLVLLYTHQGRYAEAEPLLGGILNIREKSLGPSHSDVGEALNNMGQLYENLGRYAEAEPLFKRSLAIAENTFGPDHSNAGAVLNNLSLAWRCH
jgi:tetratricopeptide (TPR) repeat protein